ncbi:MAG TPA: hypothetical protein PKA60_01160 [Candidatus Paceibacterota bacterium]|nr:hypothetical protein [Candidatus Paceibacterota bacterium]
MEYDIPTEYIKIFDDKDDIKKKLLSARSIEDLTNVIKKIRTRDNTDIIWSAVDIAKEGNVKVSFWTLKYYWGKFEELRSIEKKKLDELDKEIGEGNESIRVITTALGTLPYLINAIAGQYSRSLNLYEELICITEKMALDESLYVRNQSTIALYTFTSNIYAKKNTDGTIFYFQDLNKDELLREKVKKIALRFIEDNKKYPKILESSIKVCAPLRKLSENEAEAMLKIFFYTENGKPQPTFLTKNFCPLAIYYAIYVKKLEENFDTAKFEKFLNDLIAISDPELESSFIWHIRTALDDDISDIDMLYPYIKKLLSKGNKKDSESQYHFLVKTLINNHPDKALYVYIELTNKLNSELISSVENNRIIYFYSSEIITELYNYNRDKTVDLLIELKKLQDKHCHVDIPKLD